MVRLLVPLLLALGAALAFQRPVPLQVSGGTCWVPFRMVRPCGQGVIRGRERG
jgi:hypothetical protein